MNGAAPLAFRASAAQMAVTASLALGCLHVAVRGGYMVAQNLPRVWGQLRLAHSLGGEPTGPIWLSLAAAILALLVAGTAMALSALALLLVAGTRVLIDEHGIAVSCRLLPGPLAGRLGAGRIRWEDVTGVGRRRMRFVVAGRKGPDDPGASGRVAFLFVDGLERLMFLVMERSPNLRLDAR